MIEYISTYALGRHEHEMAEVVHGLIITGTQISVLIPAETLLTNDLQLARRNNLLAQGVTAETGRRKSVEVKWKEWAHRESIIRFDYLVFRNN